MQKFNAILLLACLLLPVAYSLKCVVCNSAYNDKCRTESKEYLIENFSVDCDKVNETLGGQHGVTWNTCRKIISLVDFDVNEEKGPIERVFRKCGYQPIDQERLACIYKAGLGGRQHACTCNDGDNCNSGTSLGATVLALFAPVAALSYYFH